MGTRLFSKLTDSFVAIELLAFFNNAKFHFYCSRELSVFGIKNIYTPHVKRIDFFAFCSYKNVSQKKSFLNINLNYNDSHQRKTTCTFLYIEKGKNCETFICICKKPDTFQKARQFPLRFYSQKSIHYTFRDFSWIFWNWHFYIFKKYDTLRYVTFFYSKSQTLRKKQDNLRYVFLHTKTLTLCVSRLFMEFLKLAGGGGLKKKSTLRKIFIRKK